jgi:hypothetical protein
MIKPDKYTTVEQSIFGLGAKVLLLLSVPKTQFSLWRAFREIESEETYARFVAALVLLYAAGAISAVGDPPQLTRA